MKLLYISGPYTADTREGIAANIAAARAAAVELWGQGFAVLCPHMNTMHFEDDCRASYDDYIKGDLLMVARCDAVVMLPGWRTSQGAGKEYAHALRHRLPVAFWFPGEDAAPARLFWLGGDPPGMAARQLSVSPMETSPMEKSKEVG